MQEGFSEESRGNLLQLIFVMTLHTLVYKNPCGLLGVKITDL